MNQSWLLKISALTSAIAAVLLLVMFFLPWPFSFDFPGIEVLTGQINLSPDEFAIFTTSLNQIQTVDTIFLFAWALAWIGFFIIVRKRNKWLGFLSLILGLGAIAFDFTENYYIGSALTRKPPDANWVGEWETALTLSYLLTYAGALVGSLSFRKKNFTGISMWIVGVFLSVIAAISFFIEGWYLISAGWYLLWFLVLSIILWKENNFIKL